MIKLDSFQCHKNESTYANKCNTSHSQKERKKIPDNLTKGRKNIWQNSTSIQIKKSHQCSYRGNKSQHNTGHFWETQPISYLKVKNWKKIPAKFRKKYEKDAYSHHFTLYSIGTLCHSNKTIKEIKVTQIDKEEVKVSLFADDTVLYIENHKVTTQKLLELILQGSRKQD